MEELIIQSARHLQTHHTQGEEEKLTNNHYLHQLTTLSLDQLKQQPLQLQATADALDAELALVCFRQFKNLLTTHQASIAANHSLHSLHALLNQFIHTTLQLDARANQLAASTQLNAITTDRQHISRILNHLPSFESLLELPQLISTCINNQHNSLWNQAIDLALKVRHLNSNLNLNLNLNPIPIPIPPSSSSSRPIGFMQLIQIQVDRTLQSLRDHLLNRLSHSNLKLPLAVRTISTLRRLSSTLTSSQADDQQQPFQPINEIELRMSFLVSRWKSLTDNLNQLQLSSGLSTTSPLLNLPQQQEFFNDHSSQLSDDRLKFLRRWIELWREFVGDTLSIYTNIFVDASASSLLEAKHRLCTSMYSSKQFLNDPQTPLNYFLTQALNLLTSLLTQHLNAINSVSSLNSLLTQLAYCGAAFGKSGFDFTATIFPLILDRLEQLIKLRFQSGLQQLQNDLRPIMAPSPTAHSFNRSTGFQIRRRSVNPFSSNPSTFVGLENCLISPDSIHQVLKLKPEAQLVEGSEGEGDNIMRHWLGFFPLLARLVNSQFTALNELRLLPSTASYEPVSEAQLESFKAATEQFVKISSVLPECPATDASGNSFLHQEQYNLESETTTEDQEKLSETRFRLVLYRLVFVWTRSVLPILERALRVGIYEELAIQSPHPRFLDLLDQSETLLRSIIPPPTTAAIQVVKTADPIPEVHQQSRVDHHVGQEQIKNEVSNDDLKNSKEVTRQVAGENRQVAGENRQVEGETRQVEEKTRQEEKTPEELDVSVTKNLKSDLELGGITMDPSAPTTTVPLDERVDNN